MTALEWGFRPSGKEVNTGLRPDQGHRIALGLSFPDSAVAAGRHGSWTERGGTFDELQVGQRVILADWKLIEDIMTVEGAIVGWTARHQDHARNEPTSRSGQVTQLHPPTTHKGKPHVMCCVVRLDGGRGTELDFYPGCLLDEPPKRQVSAKLEGGSLGMDFRSNGPTRKHRSSIFSIPGGTPLKPFIEWTPHVDSVDVDVAARLYLKSQSFELRENPKFLAVARDAISTALEKTTAELNWQTALAGERIGKAFYRKLRARAQRRLRSEDEDDPTDGHRPGLRRACI